MRDIVDNKDGTMTMSLDRYLRMVDRIDWLECLEAAGVDNWQGIEEAFRLRKEDEDGQ